ncbi:hypothetical protein BDW74DRAFT_175550 [Aspergillus multicolor]|uniref:uncharacterized protein n=1 Tax=Aspergillus multicolor TaxID=41759 RepID=UPI003CCD3270
MAILNHRDDSIPMVENATEQGVSSEIEWPTLFFWMLCFAVNAWAQPTGKLIGLSYPYPALLRSSQILSACDALGVMVNMVCTAAHSFSDIQKKAAHILAQRVVDKDDLPDIRAIQDLKRQAKSRWAGFILGALPQFIKLFACRGIAVSQGLGAMYLSSWLFFELLIAISKIDEDLQSTATPAEGRRCTKRLVKSWTLFALALDMVIWSLPTWLMWTKAPANFNPPSSSAGVARAIKREMVRTDWLSASLCALAWPIWIEIRPILGDLGLLTALTSPGPNRFTAVALFAAMAMVFDINTMALSLEWRDTPPVTELVLSSTLVPLYICTPLVAGILIDFIDTDKARSFLGALPRISTLLAQSFIFYVLVYNPEGTVHPEWLKWLG